MARRRDISRLHSEIEELFEDLWMVPRFAGRRSGFRPSVDCYRTDDPPELTVVVELAGVDPTDVELVAADQELLVSGVRRRPPLERRRSYYQMEIEYGPFRRRIPLPDDADASDAHASYDAGLLTVVLPIRPRPARPAKVSIPLGGS